MRPTIAVRDNREILERGIYTRRALACGETIKVRNFNKSYLCVRVCVRRKERKRGEGRERKRQLAEMNLKMNATFARNARLKSALNGERCY